MTSAIPARQVRAEFGEQTLTVYQAYPPEIAGPALAAGRFVAPFRQGRMTWIKPSFLWMMYRSGWGRKPGQERVLAVTITREGFEWALAHSCLSHFAPESDARHDAWAQRKRRSPVRVQWDPERSLDPQPLLHRAIQVGLEGEAARRYVEDWIVGLTDVTDLAHTLHRLVVDGRRQEAAARLPAEHPYPLPETIRAVAGAS